ncbi:MAG: DUF5610 domain-containing protein [Planctomycetota bacterium]
MQINPAGLQSAGLLQAYRNEDNAQGRSSRNIGKNWNALMNGGANAAASLQGLGIGALDANGSGQGLQNALDNLLSRAFGGLDSVELSPDASYSLQYTRAQFEVNYQSISAMSNAQGVSVQGARFSFKASFEFLQLASGGEPIQTEAASGQDLLDKLMDLFSPEKTAQRILDFALAQYAPQGADTEESRSAFADWIGDAIQKGFDQALSLLGFLPEEIQAGVDKTHELVFQGLEDFVKQGLPADQAQRTSAIQAYAQAWQLSVELEYSSFGIWSYNSDGQAASNEAQNASSTLEAVA